LRDGVSTTVEKYRPTNVWTRRTGWSALYRLGT